MLTSIELSAVKIQVLHRDGILERVLGHATGCFYKSPDDKLFLVSNWHVFTGRKPYAPRHSKTGAIPTHLRVYYHEQVSTEQGTAIHLRNVGSVEIQINTPDGENPKWRESPFRLFGDDIAVAPIILPPSAAFKPFNSWQPLDYEPRVGDSIIIVGFPSGVIGSSDALPIAKAGIIASNPAIRHKGHFRFLIDARTYSGMSGAPIFLNTFVVSNEAFGVHQTFLGVYSGRLTLPDETRTSEIGFCWRGDFIGDICKGWAHDATTWSTLSRMRESEDRDDEHPEPPARAENN